MQNTIDPESLDSMVIDEALLRQVIRNPDHKPVVLNGITENEAQPEPEDKASGVKSALFLIYFVGMILAAIVFSQTEPMLCISAVGSVFLVIGSIAVFKQGITVDNFILPVVPTAGLMMTVLPVIILYGRRHPDHALLDQAGVMDIILAGMGIFGILLAAVTPLAHIKKKARCSQTVSAVCIYRQFRNASVKNAAGRTRRISHYSPVWQYEVNGTVYVTNERVFSTDSPAIGGEQEIRFDPQYPSYIYRPIKVSLIAPVLIGAAFAVLSLTALYLHIHQ